jgi:hypothetical protein
MLQTTNEFSSHAFGGLGLGLGSYFTVKMVNTIKQI